MPLSQPSQSASSSQTVSLLHLGGDTACTLGSHTSDPVASNCGCTANAFPTLSQSFLLDRPEHDVVDRFADEGPQRVRDGPNALGNQRVDLSLRRMTRQRFA